MQVAIIGAGMAGLACASRLREAGHAVSLFDKGRGPGGRMSTRRIAVDGDTLHFDHGAQYFTARDRTFLAQVEAWQRAGLASPWPSAGSEAWVGTPAMNAPIRAMADDLQVKFATRIEAVTREDSQWKLLGAERPEQLFDVVVIAIPAEQVGPLVAVHEPSLAEQADRIVSDPCWTLMLGFDDRLPFEGDTIRDTGPIGWAARNSSKPGRPPNECWVVQASPQWSRNHLEDEEEQIAPLLFDALGAAIGRPLPRPVAISAHRWRYARSGSAGIGHYWNPKQRIGACGDWLLAPRVESAFLSGRQLADAILSESA